MSSETKNIKIGLEVHCQLTSLKTKLFCNSPSDYREKPPNTNICPVCIGTPGSLPVLNRNALYYAALVASALNFNISQQMLFFRKNYFYPDMSKNFQITQYDRAGGVPFAINGYIILDNGKKIRLGRMQLEEDPAKMTYDGTIESSSETFVDYNRAGIALIEIVSEPDLESPSDAREFLNEFSSILEYLNVSDLGLEGSVRCDANISHSGGKRVEIKNISSFKEVERALNFEMTRQKSLASKGISVSQETRHWDDIRRITISLRLKEEEQDYRYFPEADLLPVSLSETFVEGIKKDMPELPKEREKRFQREYNHSNEIARVLVKDKFLADYFEKTAQKSIDPREVGILLTVNLQPFLNETGKDLRSLDVTPNHFAELADMISTGQVSRRSAKTILLEMLKTGKKPRIIFDEKGLGVIIDSKFVENIVENVFNNNPQAVKDAEKDPKAINFLLGKIMQETRGRVDPSVANKLVKARLSTQ
tara:strand:- start:1935 stop:3371 length:1437 start_codon:yes stop_codon:yes gene_type:complete